MREVTHLGLESVDGVASDFGHAVDELVSGEFALRGRLEFPGNYEDDLTLRVQTQILQKFEHSISRNFLFLLGIFVSVQRNDVNNHIITKAPSAKFLNAAFRQDVSSSSTCQPSTILLTVRIRWTTKKRSVREEIGQQTRRK